MAPVMQSPGALPRGLRLAFVLILMAGVVVAGAPARACSCVEMDLGSRLPEADGAFVGTFVERETIDERRVAITFEVERVVKGEFGPRAIVRTDASGASCGLEFYSPQAGLLLDLASDGVWESSLCQQVEPNELLAVGGDRPPDADVAAVSAGWSPTSKALASVVVTVALTLLVLVWFARRRGAATTGGSDVA